jgi:hypothetical protein
MASIEDRQHAQRLIHEYRRRLRALEIRKARQGDSADPAIDLEIDELRLNIATLEALIEPEPAPEVQEAVKRHVEGDYTFMFAQFVKFGQRLSRVEERVDKVAQAQHAASAWRLRIGEKIDANDAARVKGQRRNLLLSIGTLAALAVLALAFLVWVL